MHFTVILMSALWALCLARPQEPTPQPPRTLTFSNVEWILKSAEHPAGPGPNRFAQDAENVFTDDTGRLHLKIVQRKSQWYCSEIISRQSFGYGVYRFVVVGNARFDPQAVLGLFTWNNADPAYHHREIDVELGRWGQKANQPAQFVVQPYTHAGNILRFDVPETVDLATYQFTWSKDAIVFRAWKGDAESPAAEDILQEWTYRGKDLPLPGGEQVRLNLWLLGGRSPQEEKPIEVVISKFSFHP